MGYGNALLDRLGDSSPLGLFDELDVIHFELMDRLDQPDGRLDHVVFPVSCVISMLTTSDEASCIELVTVGNEGFVGVPVLLGTTCLMPGELARCQVPGSAWRIATERFQDLTESEPAMWKLMARYAQAYQSLLARQVLCNLIHSIDQRVSRWLLVTADRAGASEFPLTQDFLAEMLGVRRASVSVAEGRLRHAGLIRYGRGRMQLLDRPGLERLCCSCYRVMNERMELILDRS